MAKSSSGKGPANANRGGAPRKLVTTKGGSPNLKAIPPTHASHIGRSIGNHAMDTGGKVLNRPPTPGPVAKKAFVPMGNAVALNVGKGGPGAGRVVSPCGTQGQQGPVNQGANSGSPALGGAGGGVAKPIGAKP